MDILWSIILPTTPLHMAKSKTTKPHTLSYCESVVQPNNKKSLESYYVPGLCGES